MIPQLEFSLNLVQSQFPFDILLQNLRSRWQTPYSRAAMKEEDAYLQGSRMSRSEEDGVTLFARFWTLSGFKQLLLKF
jgi:hypothetical protein